LYFSLYTPIILYLYRFASILNKRTLIPSVSAFTSFIIAYIYIIFKVKPLLSDSSSNSFSVFTSTEYISKFSIQKEHGLLALNI